MIEKIKMNVPQKNIMDIMFTYEEKELGNLGGYYRIDGDIDLSVAIEVMKSAVYVHRGLSLVYSGNRCMGYMGEYEPEIQHYHIENNDVESAFNSWFVRPFDFNGGCLFEFAVFEFSDESIYLCEKFHHLIIDRNGVSLIWKWQIEACEKIKVVGLEKWKESLCPDERYIQMLRKGSEVMMSEKRTAEFLNNNFSDKTQSWLDNPVSISSRAESTEFLLDTELSGSLEKYTLENRITKESVMTMAFILERAIRKGVTHIVFGRMGMFRKRNEEDIVGLFSRVMPVSFEVSDEPVNKQCEKLDQNFRIALRYADRTIIEYNEIAEDTCFSFDTITSYHPLEMLDGEETSTKYYTDVIDGESLTDQSAALKVNISGMSSDVIRNNNEDSNSKKTTSERYGRLRETCIDTPLRLWFNEKENGMGIECFYQKEHYNKKKINSVISRYIHVLRQIIEGKEIKEIELLSEDDVKAYEKLNSEERVFPVKTTWQEFLSRCETHPEEICLEDEKEAWNREQAVRFFYAVADYVDSKAGKGDVVGVCMKRQIALPVVMLAVRSKRAAFFPILKEELDARRDFYEGICKYIITDDDVKEIIQSAKANTEYVKETNKTEQGHDGENLSGDKIIIQSAEANTEYVKETNKTEQGHDAENLSGDKTDTGNSLKMAETEGRFSLSELNSERAYLMCTSGTTGEPKVVQISEFSLMCRLAWMYRKYGAGDVTMQKTVCTFDVSIWELFLNLMYGGKLYLPANGTERMPDEIIKKIKEKGVTRIHFVPGMLRLFIEEYKSSRNKKTTAAERNFDSSENTEFGLCEIFASGDVLDAELARETMEIFPNVRLINLYGPTECTIDVSYHECVSEDFISDGADDGMKASAGIPIGRAVSNTNLSVRAWNGDAVMPVGVPGELCVSRDLTGMGYLGEEQGGYRESDDGSRIFRTGDEVILEENGELTFIGRRDRQVKLRGMRTDIGSVETVLMGHPDIHMVFATARDNRLYAFYQAEKSIGDLKGFVLRKLQLSHVPDVFIHVKEFPVKANGKTDHEKLWDIYNSINKADNSPNNDIERDNKKNLNRTLSGNKKSDADNNRIIQLLAPFFPNESIESDDNIFDKGIDSFTAMKVISELRDNGFDCSFSTLYNNPVVEELCKVLSGREKEKNRTNSTRGIDFIIDERCAELFLAIPYAGGTGESMIELAGLVDEINKEEKKMDFAVVKYDDFGNVSIERIAGYIMRYLKGYRTVTLFGYCVGSALVLELSKLLCAKNEGDFPSVKQIYIAGSLPPVFTHVGKRVLSPWDLMSDERITKMLVKAGVNDDDSNIIIKRIPEFRRDAKRFFGYFYINRKKAESYYSFMKSVPVTMFFGKNDSFTSGWKRKYNRWRRYFHGKIKVVVLEGEGHYFMNRLSDALIDELRKC